MNISTELFSDDVRIGQIECKKKLLNKIIFKKLSKMMIKDEEKWMHSVHCTPYFHHMKWTLTMKTLWMQIDEQKND